MTRYLVHNSEEVRITNPFHINKCSLTNCVSQNNFIQIVKRDISNFSRKIFHSYNLTSYFVYKSEEVRIAFYANKRSVLQIVSHKIILSKLLNEIYRVFLLEKHFIRMIWRDISFITAKRLGLPFMLTNVAFYETIWSKSSRHIEFFWKYENRANYFIYGVSRPQPSRDISFSEQFNLYGKRRSNQLPDSWSDDRHDLISN